MREIIKMVFFRTVFLFGLACLVAIVCVWVDSKVSSLQWDLEDIEKKKLEEQKKWLEFRIKWIEDYTSRLSEKYYDLLNKYYNIMDCEICWKTVEQRLIEDKEVSKKKK